MSNIYNFTTYPLTSEQIAAGIKELPADKHKLVQDLLHSSLGTKIRANSLAIIANNIGAKSCLIEPGKLAVTLNAHLSCRGIDTNLRCDM
jgi:hypothetical protein